MKWKLFGGAPLTCGLLYRVVATPETNKVTWSTNGLVGSTEIACMRRTKVKSLRSDARLLIASHSPNALLETGLHMWPPEKSQGGDRLRW
jgi:hypothetical protein